MMTKTGIASWGFAAVAAAALLATPAGAASWKDSPEVKALYEKAKAEGKVVIWGPQRNEVEWVGTAFPKEFPGIKVEWAGDNEAMTRAITEARAGRHQVDVFWNSLTGMQQFVSRDLVTPINWSIFGVPASNVALDGKMAYGSSIAYAIAYNTDLAKKEDVPTRWEQVLDEKYKGKLTSSLFLLPRLLGALSMKWGFEKSEDVARKLTTQQNTLLTRSPRESIITSGERVFAVGEIDLLVRVWMNSGLKVDYVIPEPVVIGNFGSSVMAKAPNPNAARLLAGYIASEEGRKARRDMTFADDYTSTGTGEIAKKIQSKQIEFVSDTPEEAAARDKATQQLGPIIAGQK